MHDRRRGVALGIAHDHYTAGGPSYFAEANNDLMVIALLETTKAFERLEEIVSVPGVDVAWMGLTISRSQWEFRPNSNTQRS